MTRPYSLDLRLRAISLVESGHSRRQVARLLDLGEVDSDPLDASEDGNRMLRGEADGWVAPCGFVE